MTSSTRRNTQEGSPCRPRDSNKQLLVRRGPGLAAGGEAALCNLLVQVLAREPSAKGGSVICNLRRKICCLRWHSVMWMCLKSWRKSLALWTDARLLVVQQI